MPFISSLWSVPFMGIVLSMSFLPLLCPKFWEKYAFSVPLFWSAAYLFSVGCFFGVAEILPAVVEPLLADYIPFMALIFALYVVSGGIFVDFPGRRGPFFNTAFLFFGSVIAGWIGTTGATALLIRPFLRANSGRKYTVHLPVFFIFLVANAGGAATPLGDPPLFMGFLKGIDFFWFIRHLYLFLTCTVLLLCALFFAIDFLLFRREAAVVSVPDENKSVEFEGKINLILTAAILAAVMFCNFDGEFSLCGGKFSRSSLTRSAFLLIIALISMKITPTGIREKNMFSSEPIKEVAQLFAGIFITVTPIISILHQGSNGTFGGLFDWMAPGGEFLAERCFWVSGLLSSVLDNAPTFLIFFHMTAGDPGVLMTTKSHILTAFSLSTVFMGALTYIGNAPNLIVKSVSLQYGAKVPSFLGYMVWSAAVMLPILTLISRFL
ncbi:MAG: sodium:proton antiporter [Holosporaceae bacterium]|jgi:Na+/H+ antiporter NhaD/arsenite permease-like protein|nr:sodium:proton antiporter [Holosporaceae bacterium]